MRPNRRLSFVVVALLGVTQAFAADRQIGHAGGVPVHESQIQGSTDAEREASLRSLFIGPAIRAYLEPHEAEWKLTDAEVSRLASAYRDSLACKTDQPGEEMTPEFQQMFAQFIGGNTKIQRFIYLNNGRGRLLFQQAGMEAFDATRTLLLRLEAEGKFHIDDPAMRDAALSYWMDDNQPGLLPDPGADEAFVLAGLIEACPAG